MKNFIIKLAVILLAFSCSNKEDSTHPNLDYDSEVHISRTFEDDYVKLYFIKNCDTLKVAYIRSDIYSLHNDSLVVSVVKEQIKFETENF